MSYPSTPSKRYNTSLVPPTSARRASSADSTSSHTIIDPFGSLHRSHQGFENTNIKTPKTPIDPLYRHPFHSKNSPSDFTSVGDDHNKVTRASSALPNIVSWSPSQHGSHHHHTSNTPVTPNGNKCSASSNPYITPPSLDFANTVHQTTTCCCYANPTKSNSECNCAQATFRGEDRFSNDSRVNTALLSVLHSTDLNLDASSSFKGEEGSVRDDRSSDETMVICEPSGLISLLSRSFQYLFSILQPQTLPVLVEFEEEDKKRDQEDGEVSAYNDDFSADDDDDDDDSQDSAFHSQPASPQTPLCWPGIDAAQSRFPPPPPPVPVFYYPPSHHHHHGHHPRFMRLPPNWLPWRSGCVNEHQDRGGPPPLLPTLSPHHHSDDVVDNHHHHRGNSFPVLPPRPLSHCRWATAMQQADWIMASESPVPGLSASPPLIRPVPATALPPASHHHGMHSMTTLGPSIRCPISGGIMLEPVIDPDGFSYEKRAILEWLSKHTTSPITNRLLTPNDLRPNRTLQCVIQNLLQNMNTK